MALSATARDIYTQISGGKTKLGDLRKLAKEIKRDHELAMELWSTGDFHVHLLAVLIMDKKLLTQDIIEQLVADIKEYEYDQRNQLADWLMANQLTKNKKLIGLMESWEKHPYALLRRMYWYNQGRLRWAGKTPPDNTIDLLPRLESNLSTEEPEVQWAMNFTAAQIGISEPAFRARCIALGERIGLYKDKPVARGCTPDYLPEWIRIEVAKLEKS